MTHKASLSNDTSSDGAITLLGGGHIQTFISGLDTVVNDYLHKKTYSVLQQIPLGIIKAEFQGEIIEMPIALSPLQDFMTKDIIQNIATFKSLDLCNIEVDVKKYNIGNINIIHLINSNKDLSQAIVSAICTLEDRILERVTGVDKIFAIREKTSKDIYDTMMAKYPPSPGYKPQPFDFPVLTKDGLFRYYEISGFGLFSEEEYAVFNKKLTKIEDNFQGPQNAKKIERYLRHLQTMTQEFNQELLIPLLSGEKSIQIDTKYLYMDNGHYLYKDILANSKYHNYYIKEIELIEQKKESLKKFLRERYWGLGVGDGQKDLALLRDTSVGDRTILMDSSIESLQEAELAFTLNQVGFRQMGGVDVGLLSQDWIDTMVDKGEMIMMQSSFRTQHTVPFHMPDIRGASNTFSMLGGTFGNFDNGYKVKFIKNMDKLMSKGDYLLLSLFNKPESQEEINDIIAHYDNSFVHTFIKNFFIKIGLPEDTIDIKVGYTNDTITIDAHINKSTTLTLNGKTVPVESGTVFTCFKSERMDAKRIQDIIKQAGCKLKLKEHITSDGNPFTIYAIEK